MKQLFLTLVFLFALLGGGSAQELTVKSMETKPMDLSASTNPRLDKNNQPCGLVKVRLAAPGAAFAGNVLGEVENHEGVYWVYMSQGSYMLQVRHPEYVALDVNFRDYGIRGVESKVTYVLTLLKPQTENVKKQKLIINYSPANAMVLIDGKTYRGNGRVEEELPTGEHSYVIAAEGYLAAEGTVKLNGGNQRVLNETLEKETVVATTQQSTATQTQEIMPTESAAATTATSNMDNGHEWVDLGLSVCWATTNVGASKPSDYGDYYAWGEKANKRKYDWGTYKHNKGGKGRGRGSIIKYCTHYHYGTVDSKTVLDLSDDAAQVKWGGNWRMPTIEELNELEVKCEWVWSTQDGHHGYKVKGPNGNSIFLPAAGCRYDTSPYDVDSYGVYWSRTLSPDSPDDARYLLFDSSGIRMDSKERYYGFSVRPVRLPE